jgi:hypothetical protein
MKKQARVKNARLRRARSGHCAVGAALLVGATLTPAADKDTSNFEGPADAGNNWIELSAGGMFPSGSTAQAQQSRRLQDGAFGGIEDLHLQHDVAKGTTFSLDGRGIYDNHDYSLSLGLKKEELYFLRLNFENFRTWYNGNGGYYPYGNAWYPNPYAGDEAFALDRGEISFAGGWTPKDLPSLTFKYRHLYRDGEKSSTSWGYSHPGLVFPTRGLQPSFYDIDEQRDIFELDAKYRYKATDFGLGLSYEQGEFDNARKMWQYRGEPDPIVGTAQDRKITDREGVSYNAFNVHAFSETWIKPNLFLSAGLLYSSLGSDTTGSRVYGDSFDVGVSNPGNLQGFYNLNGGGEKHEYVGNVNLMATPVKHLTVVPSIRVQKEDWNADSSAIPTTGGVDSGQATSNTDGDALDVRERLDVRYSGVTNWVFFAQGEWTQGQGNLDELGGVGAGSFSTIHRETEDTRLFQKYSLGVKWYPARRLSLEVGGYYKKNNYDYDHLSDPAASVTNLYPAYLTMRDLATHDGNVRMTWRPAHNLSLVTRYEYQWSTVNTTVAGQDEVESSQMTSHIFAQNVNWTPWSRLYLQAGFNLVASETKTPASDYTQAILNAQNNYWTLTFNSGFVLDNKTDLNLGYAYCRADNYEDNSAVGLPYGVGASEHGINATVVRRLTEKLRLTLRYGYYVYNDETSGGHNDYDAHVVYSGLQYRF